MRFSSLLVHCLVLLLLLANGDEFQIFETRQLERFRLARQPLGEPDSSIVILGLDDEVFRQNRFNRQEHARVIQNLTRAGARQIFFDIIFDESRGPEMDRPLLEAIAASRRVTIAGVYQIDTEDASLKAIRPKFFPELEALVRQGICGVGIINTATTASKIDGLLAIVDPLYASPRLSAAVALLAADQHLSPTDVEVVPPTALSGGRLNIPPLSLEVHLGVQKDLQILKGAVRYHPAATGPKGDPGGPGRIKVFPYLKVADGDPATLAEMKGKFVLIGENTTSSTDSYPTPVGILKGVEIHAQLLNTLVNQDAPHLAREGSRLYTQSIILILFFCLALGEALRRQPSLWRCGLCMFLSLVTWELLVYGLDRQGYFLAQTLGYASLFVTSITAMVMRYLATHRVLSTFVPKAIADQLIREEEIHQGAVVATVMVTDIRGYTTLSESRTPLQVLQLLNDYHGETVALYQKFGGHVLNYQGDAQIILFGHPKKQRDAALQAILAAQAASSAVDRLRKRWNLPPDQTFNVGAGICTGKVIIAELGGEYREYTVIGELVRKCHKLQSQSQVLGANIILDEETYHVCRKKPEVEKRENVLIEGLPGPVTVYITDIVKA